MSASEPTKFTILIVEDEPLVRMTMADYLVACDCDVIEARDGKAAVTALQNGHGIDVVFTDIRLGGDMNGWDVGEASRAVDPEMPVIYTSGATITPPRQVPGSLFFNKPYDPAKVLEACRTLQSARGE